MSRGKTPSLFPAHKYLEKMDEKKFRYASTEYDKAFVTNYSSNVKDIMNTITIKNLRSVRVLKNHV
jgi:hypothetical protein